ncbi:MAG: virginiamycin A acetyltransferase [Mariniblastus sp.]|jgi:virginiamycin A acetyltransferase
MLHAHPTANISPLADIEESSRGTRIEVGADCLIDSFVKIKCAGGVDDVVIGCSSYINSGTVIYTGNGVKIGSHVLIAANCTLAPVNHEFSDPNRPIVEQGFQPSKGGIQIEDDVWIGANTVVLDGAKIGRGCVVGANSLVNKTLEPMGIYAGSPCRKIGERK